MKLASALFREYIISNDHYSNEIKSHLGITKEWIDNYFDFKLIRSRSKTLLDFDAVAVDLRNQVFIERLVKIASDNSDKDIWFIVGEDHLVGLEKLFLEQFSDLKIKIIPGEEKQKLIDSSPSVEYITSTTPPRKSNSSSEVIFSTST